MYWQREDMARAVAVLQEGGVLLYPTDTVWGIGCDATNAAAVRRIFGIKQREDSKAMLVLAADESMVREYTDAASAVYEQAEQLSQDGRPTTFIYPHARKERLAPELIAEDGSIGIRITKEAFSQQLCRLSGKPIVSTSANISGQPSPQTFAQITEPVRQAVDYICQYRREDTTEHQPSRLVKIQNDGTIILLRS